MISSLEIQTCSSNECLLCIEAEIVTNSNGSKTKEEGEPGFHAFYIIKSCLPTCQTGVCIAFGYLSHCCVWLHVLAQFGLLQIMFRISFDLI